MEKAFWYDENSDMKISMERIAIDLIPLLPGGENGGAKMVATELVRHLSLLLPETEFILLTSERSHEELSYLDAPNVRRICMAIPKIPIASSSPMQNRPVGIRLREWVACSLPPPLRARVKNLYRALWAFRRLQSGIVNKVGANLLFCPFTVPFYYDSAIPVVSIIYDLQYHYYPQFFEWEDRHSRESNFQVTCRLADRLVCISEYVRGTVLENSNRTPEEVIAVPIRLFTRLRKPVSKIIEAMVQKHGLRADEFLLYPANFWPHKNHPMLLTAFAMYRSRHPQSSLKLLCTGSADARMETLREAAWRMGIGEWIRLPGYLSDEEFSTLLTSCRALIFPSLYEGFGMPVLEAMAFGKPVLCSNVTSLPEVAGDAALYFDPRKPEEIMAAIARIMAEPELTARLVERGDQRVASFGDPRQMALEYLDVFRAALENRRLRRREWDRWPGRNGPSSMPWR